MVGKQSIKTASIMIIIENKTEHNVQLLCSELTNVID